MGNVFSRFNGCVGTEIIEYSRRDSDCDNDSIELMDHLEFVEVGLDGSDIEIELV